MGFVSKSENNRFKNKVKYMIDQAKISYYKSAFNSARNNLNSTWKLIRSLTSHNSSKCNIKRILWRNIEYKTDLDIAEAFNRYFCSVATDLESKLPATNTDPISYLDARISQSMFLVPVTPVECARIIVSLKPIKTDIDSLPVKFFIEHHSCFINVICQMINQSFTTGKFPSPLKIATTVPILKKGDPFRISNYRPISILPYLSKIFEKCINRRLLDFLSSHNILSPDQFGSVQNSSTTDPLKIIKIPLVESSKSRYIFRKTGAQNLYTIFFYC